MIAGMGVKQRWTIIKLIRPSKMFSQKILLTSAHLCLCNVFRKIKTVICEGKTSHIYWLFLQISQNFLESFMSFWDNQTGNTDVLLCTGHLNFFFVVWSLALRFLSSFLSLVKLRVICLSACPNSIQLENCIHQSLFCQKYLMIWFYGSIMEMSSSLSGFTVQSVHFRFN